MVQENKKKKKEIIIKMYISISLHILKYFLPAVLH